MHALLKAMLMARLVSDDEEEFEGTVFHKHKPKMLMRQYLKEVDKDVKNGTITLFADEVSEQVTIQHWRATNTILDYLVSLDVPQYIEYAKSLENGQNIGVAHTGCEEEDSADQS